MYKTAEFFCCVGFVCCFFLAMVVTMQIKFILRRLIIAGVFYKEDGPAFW